MDGDKMGQLLRVILAICVISLALNLVILDRVRTRGSGPQAPGNISSARCAVNSCDDCLDRAGCVWTLDGICRAMDEIDPSEYIFTCAGTL